MNIKQIIQWWLTLACLLFVTACSDEALTTASESGHRAGSIVLRLGTAGEMQTRTQLKGSYSLHNVQQTFAVLYSGEGDDAEYICHQDLNWNPREETGYGDGVIQQKDFEIVAPSTLSDGSYTILCVGLDDCSAQSYMLEMGDGKAPSFCREGGKLSEALAVLASGETMKYSELFAGCGEFTYTADRVNAVSVEMRRRVAGVYAYLKDIPMAINGREVRFVRLTTDNLPTAGIGLAGKGHTEGELPDDFGFGAQDESAKVLDAVELTAIATAGENNLYDIKKEYTESLGLQSNTLLLGSYVIPMEAGAGNTISIELLDGTQEVIKRFPALWSAAPGGVDTQRYPVFPDYIYHIGTRDQKSDRPVSIEGNRIEIEVQPWKEVAIFTEFPDVPLDATIGYDKNPTAYIYDCINTTETVDIYPSLMKKDWRLTIVAEDKSGKIDPGNLCDWLYFKLPDGSYAQEIYSKNYSGWKDTNVKIDILINDYVEERDIDVEYNSTVPSGQEAINTDWRRARIVLQTDESSSNTFLSFRQYNAITVKGQYKYGVIKRDYKSGFSRFDMGVERDRNGKVTTQGVANGWGFWTSAFFQIHQPFTYDSPDCEPCYDGEVCYASAARNEKGFPSSIIDISRCESMEWTGTENRTGDHFWYIPSQLELYSFFNGIVRYGDIDSNVEAGAIYWSGTAYCDTRILESRVRSYCQSTNDISATAYALRKGNVGYTRRARKFK